MQDSKMVPVVRKYGITVYGKVINPSGKLGQYELHTHYAKPIEYTTFKEAERRFDELCFIAEKLGSQGLRNHLEK